MKRTLTTALATAVLSSAVMAGPAERAGRLDKRLTVAERSGAWEQGSRADRMEAGHEIELHAHRLDRREDIRDRAVTHGPRDLREDRLDRAENKRDRLENRRDRSDGHWRTPREGNS